MDAALKTFLGKTARAARVQMGLTQAQVAERARLAVPVYGRIERGGILPSVPTVLRLCRALDLDPNALLGFCAPTPPPWFAPAHRAQQRPTVHPLLGTARRLGRRQLTVLGTLARAMRLTEDISGQREPPPRGADAVNRPAALACHSERAQSW